MSYRCNCPTVFCSECFASRNHPQFLYGSATISALLPPPCLFINMQTALSHLYMHISILLLVGGVGVCPKLIGFFLFRSIFLLNHLLHRNWDILLTIKEIYVAETHLRYGKAWHPFVAFTSVGDHSFLELDSRPSIEEQPKPSTSQSNQPGRLRSYKELRWQIVSS